MTMLTPTAKKREPGNMENYERVGDYARCKNCGADVLGARVAHPIWIRGFAGGPGRCKFETVPYCPNCDNTPNPSGAPVYADYPDL